MKRALLSGLLLSVMSLSSAALAAEKGLIVIIIPSHDNPFFKTEADGAAQKAKKLVTARWWPCTMTTSVSRIS